MQLYLHSNKGEKLRASPLAGKDEVALLLITQAKLSSSRQLTLYLGDHL